jgi:hypothetical protein
MNIHAIGMILNYIRNSMLHMYSTKMQITPKITTGLVIHTANTHHFQPGIRNATELFFLSFVFVGVELSFEQKCRRLAKWAGIDT